MNPLEMKWRVSDILDNGSYAIITEHNHIIVGFGCDIPREALDRIVDDHNTMLKLKEEVIA